ncbi:MAG: ribosomal RNA small subunit methyltransferase A [Bdellovibrionales bacterium]|nr:ribosomal RNA small subunit methyltransferase A [Bdellovibrionales bacterium]
MAIKRSKHTLRELGVKPSRHRGQNFLQDQAVIDRILEYAGPLNGENLIEIGPGLGALTRELVPYGNLRVIEIEPSFCQELANLFPDLQIINADVRSVNLSEMGPDLVVLGNLPYRYSTDIIFHLIDHAAAIKFAVLMLQREFAERLAAGPGGRDYGVLSIAAQLWADISTGPRISKESFYPRPQVESSLVRLEFLRKPRYEIADLDWFKKVVRAGFLQRRRKLANSLKSSGIFSGDQILEALSVCNIDGGRRAETLGIGEFVELAGALRRNQD